MNACLHDAVRQGLRRNNAARRTTTGIVFLETLLVMIVF